MVSFTLDAVKFLLIYRYLQNTYWFKREIRTALISLFRPSNLPTNVKISNFEAHADMYTAIP